LTDQAGERVTQVAALAERIADVREHAGADEPTLGEVGLRPRPDLQLVARHRRGGDVGAQAVVECRGILGEVDDPIAPGDALRNEWQEGRVRSLRTVKERANVPYVREWLRPKVHLTLNRFHGSSNPTARAR